MGEDEVMSVDIKELLLAIEWVIDDDRFYHDLSNKGYIKFCPYCHQRKQDKHFSDCKLMLAIKEDKASNLEEQNRQLSNENMHCKKSIIELMDKVIDLQESLCCQKQNYYELQEHLKKVEGKES